MSLVVYDSQAKTKKPFVPLHGNRVNMYVCGITAYDYSHIGHARSVVVFDVVVRYLRFRGYEVRFVRNFTDIDDKIIRRAAEEGCSWDEVSRKYIEEFRRDMAALGALDPDHEPLASEFIPHMIETIRILVEKGHAYEVDGDVYFSVESFPGYGKLSGRDIHELVAGVRIEVDTRKRNPLDFALWKHAKPGEPHWPSPWGEGRPGWHIECSVMSTRLLGPTLDIHGGGKDLIFPHHENEIAQAEAATGRPFVRYWMHNGFVNIDREKMSKSLGNIRTIREILDSYSPEAVRLFLLSKHYRSPLDFSVQAMDEAEHGVERVYQTFRRVDETCGEVAPESPDPALLTGEAARLWERCSSLEERFVRAMDDDFNTARAVGFLFDLAKAMNRLLGTSGSGVAPGEAWVLRESREQLRRIGAVLGLFQAGWKEFLDSRSRRILEARGVTVEQIEGWIRERNEARSRKDWSRADEIRDRLKSYGVVLEDGRQGTTWRIA